MNLDDLVNYLYSAPKGSRISVNDAQLHWEQKFQTSQEEESRYSKIRESRGKRKHNTKVLEKMNKINEQKEQMSREKEKVRFEKAQKKAISNEIQMRVARYLSSNLKAKAMEEKLRGKPIELNAMDRISHILGSSEGGVIEKKDVSQSQQVFPITPLQNVDDYISTLKKSPRSLTEINLSNQSIQNEGMKKLMEFLNESPKNFKIETLLLDGNDITEEGAISLAQFLRNSDSVSKLDLRWNQIGSNGTTVVAQALESNRSLKWLNLEGNEVGQGVEAIALMITKNTALRYLSLKENYLGDDGVISLGNALEKNSSLRELDLSRNDIMEEGINAIVQGLKKNNTLHTLILNDNVLCDEGVTLLSEVARMFKDIQIRNNCVESTALYTLLEQFKQSSKLQRCDISLNSIELQLELALQELLETKPSLDLIWKDNGAETVETEEEINQVIQYFGLEKILSKILEGKTLEPLCDIQKLIQEFKFSSEHKEILDNFVQQTFSENIEYFHNGINLIMGLCTNNLVLKKQNSKNIKLEELPIIFQSIFHKLQQFRTTLISSKQEPGPQFCVKTTKKDKSTPLGFARLEIVNLLMILIKNNYECLNLQIVQAGFLKLIQELFFEYYQNSVFQCEVVELIKAILESRSDSLLNELLEKTSFAEKLAKLCQEESKKPVNQRTPNFGHCLEIAGMFHNCKNDTVQKLLNNTIGWKSFVDLTLKNAKQEQRGYLGGTPPKRDPSASFPFLREKMQLSPSPKQLRITREFWVGVEKRFYADQIDRFSDP